MHPGATTRRPSPSGAARAAGPILVLLALIGTLPASARAATQCQVEASHYRGWNSERLSNRFVSLEIVPQLGGRLMQVTFGGHEFLFVNPRLAGQMLPPDTERHRWFNYGGDKIWPMPEGSGDERHWPGAGGEPLDAAPFTLQVLSRGARCAVRLTGPADPLIGQRYVRDIGIDANSPAISFHAVMTNVSGYPQAWSEQSVSQYEAGGSGPGGFNPSFYGIAPVNARSAYLLGYHVRTGLADNPAYAVAGGLFRLHWMNVEGEVWLDSPAGWLAIVDGTSGFAMVERFRYDPRANYPGKATVIFYSTGQRGGSPPTAAAALPPIHYMEAELNSPVVELAPGESFAMDTEWTPTRLGPRFATATFAGAVGEALAATPAAGGVALTGIFGVFYAGRLVAHFYDREGQPLGIVPLGAVSPLAAVELRQTVAMPANTARVSLHLVDEAGVDRGPLGEAPVAEAQP